MLAKKESKTFWTASTGVAFEEKEDAEFHSVEAALQDWSNKEGVTPLTALLEGLEQQPDVKRWLLEQLGVKPDRPVHMATVMLQTYKKHSYSHVSESEMLLHLASEMQSLGYTLTKK